MKHSTQAVIAFAFVAVVAFAALLVLGKDYMHSGKPSSASMCGASFISELDARDVAGVRNPTAALDEYAKKVGAKSRYDLTVDQSTKAFKLALGCPEVTP